MIYCPICNRELKSDKAKIAHVWRAHSETGIAHGQKTGSKTKGRVSHRKGLTKETSEEIRKTAEKVSATAQRKIAEGTFVPTRMGQEARKKLSVEQSLNNRGGKCKWFDYKGQKLQGTWELNIAKKLDEMNIDWYKPKVHRDVWTYELDGQEKSYTPDLFLKEHDVYLEIKGYWWGDDKRKMEAVRQQHPEKKIVIIEKNEYNRIMQGELVW